MWALLAAGAPAWALLTGCSLGLGAVELDPHDTVPGTGRACARLLAALPDVIDDAVRRDVSPDDGTAAAWGVPPLVLRCGVPRPPEYRADAQLLSVDGVDWLPVPGSGGDFFTTVGREADVEVAVPERYAPAAGVLVALGPGIRDALPEAR